MKKLLIITTINDRSLPLFFTKKIKDKMDVEVCLISDDASHIAKVMETGCFDFIYLRDPFTDQRIPFQEAEKKCSGILEDCSKSYVVDALGAEDDILFEDKWNQYKIFYDRMPKTQIMKREDRTLESMIFKKRISSRAKGIVFEGNRIKKGFSKFIVQERLDIKKEYRVFIIFGNVMETVEVKSSKTEKQKVKAVRKMRASKRLLDFSREVIGRTDLDFAGIDVAETSDGRLYLLEVNRSCLFDGFYRLTGVNLAEVFVDGLLEKTKAD